MATAGVINAITREKTQKHESITVLKQVEWQGELVQNAVETPKDNLRFLGRNGSADGAGGLIPNNMNTVIMWGAGTEDPANLDSAGVYVCPVNGIYSISFTVQWDTGGGAATLHRSIFVQVNGVVAVGVRRSKAAGTPTWMNFSMVRSCNIGDQISFVVNHNNSGNPLALLSCHCDIEILRIDEPIS